MEQYYRDKKTKITAPFYIAECNNGHVYYEITPPHVMKCYYCGEKIKIRIPQKKEQSAKG